MLSIAAAAAAYRHSTAATEQTRRETGTKITIHQAVDDEVETGVQVRQHGRVEVNGQRQTVRVVAQQHDDVRAPAADERDEDDEHRFHPANSLHRRKITGFGRSLCSKSKHGYLDDDSHDDNADDDAKIDIIR